MTIITVIIKLVTAFVLGFMVWDILMAAKSIRKIAKSLDEMNQRQEQMMKWRN